MAKSKKKKGAEPAPVGLAAAVVPFEITDARKVELAGIVAHLVIEKQGIKAEITGHKEAIRSRNKRVKEIDELILDRCEQIGSGVEMTAQRDMFAHRDPSTPAAESRIGAADAGAALTAVAAHMAVALCTFPEKPHAFRPFEGVWIDGRGLLVCKECHDASQEPAAWPEAQRLEAEPTACGKCGAGVERPVGGLALVCANKSCTWTAIVGDVPTSAPVDDVAEAAAASTVPEGSHGAAGGPAEVAAGAKPSSGFDFDAAEPAPKIDPAQAGPVAIEAQREPELEAEAPVDDIGRAAQRDAEAEGIGVA